MSEGSLTPSPSPSPSSGKSSSPDCMRASLNNNTTILQDILLSNQGAYRLKMARAWGSCLSPQGQEYSPSSRDSGYHTPSPRSSPAPAPPHPSQHKLMGLLMGARATNHLTSRPCGATKRGRVSESSSDGTTEGGDSPLDLSCKKKRSRSDSSLSQDSDTSGSSAGRASPLETATERQSSILKSILCGTSQQRDYLKNSDSQLSDLQSFASPSSAVPSATSSPCLTTNPPRPLQTEVTLAKKNVPYVSSKVSDWLIKLVQFARNLPEFCCLSHDDQIILLLSSWSRLMLLFMAESAFEFVVTPLHSSSDATAQDKAMTSSALCAEDIPTARTVETVQRFIQKCQTMKLDEREYHCLKLAVLFHTSYSGIEKRTFVDNVNNFVRQALQDHVTRFKPREPLRYSQLLLTLPLIFAVSPRMIERLFCVPIVETGDVTVLIKDLLLKL